MVEPKMRMLHEVFFLFMNLQRWVFVGFGRIWLAVGWIHVDSGVLTPGKLFSQAGLCIPQAAWFRGWQECSRPLSYVLVTITA